MKSSAVSNQGFTLLEILIVTAILIVLFGLGLPSFLHFQESFMPAANASRLAHTLTTASRSARLGVENKAWGVYFNYNETTRAGESITIFAGNSYLSRDTNFDRITTLPSGIKFNSVSLSGAVPSSGNDHEIVFSANRGETTQYGSIEVETADQEFVVTVSSLGIPVVEY